MGADYSFFALLFLIAQSLSPGASGELSWVNGDHPDQTITFTHAASGGWELEVNGRELGVFHRQGDAVVLHQEGGAPQRFPVASLANRVTPNSRRVALRGSWGGTVLAIDREGGRVRLRDRTRAVLGTDLLLRTR